MTLTEGAPGAGLWLSRDNGKTWEAFDGLAVLEHPAGRVRSRRRRRDPRHHLRRQRLARTGRSGRAMTGAAGGRGGGQPCAAAAAGSINTSRTTSGFVWSCGQLLNDTITPASVPVFRMACETRGGRVKRQTSRAATG